MKMISRNEEILLLTILKLEDNAYGVSIREQIAQDMGDTWSFASIYTPLDKLVRKELVQKIKGEPSPERGGKSKFYYQLTSAGKQTLTETRKANDQLWSGLPNYALD